MRATVVILDTVEAQREAGDSTIIDPAGVSIEGAAGMPIWSNFGYRFPEDVLGRVLALRLENGRLVADVDVQYDWLTKVDDNSKFRYSVAGHPGEFIESESGAREVKSMDFLQVGVVSKGPAQRA